MKIQSLRKLQQKGEESIEGNEPILLLNRNGPVGILIPATEKSLPYLQSEIEKISALQSLRASWDKAQLLGLSDISEESIESEVKSYRLSKRKKNARKNRRS